MAFRTGVPQRHQIPHPPVADLSVVQSQVVVGAGPGLHMYWGAESGGSS